MSQVLPGRSAQTDCHTPALLALTHRPRGARSRPNTGPLLLCTGFNPHPEAFPAGRPDFSVGLAAGRGAATPWGSEAAVSAQTPSPLSPLLSRRCYRSRLLVISVPTRPLQTAGS